MGEYLDQVPENIQVHIKNITKTSGLPESEESLEQMAELWLEKRKSIEAKCEEMNMEEVEILEKDDSRGAIAMTYSGSLLTVGPITDDGRTIEYASIGLRQDVPESLSKEGCSLSEDIVVDKELSFEEGPIKRTSPLFKILVYKEQMEAIEEEEQIKKAATMIIEDFVEVNKTIVQ